MSVYGKKLANEYYAPGSTPDTEDITGNKKVMEHLVYCEEIDKKVDN